MIDLQLAREQARALSGPVTPARVAAEGICPFKGLASFEPVDADYFFGRERLVAELVARLVGARFLGIVGPSGSGKSSVLRAGLLPALAGGVLPGSEGWRRLLLRPGERPLDELRRVLVSGAKDPLAEALDALPRDARLLLAVDQFEELFTACRSDAERAAFADTLARAAADPEGRAVVVVALRADFYGRFAAYPALAELLGANHVLVGPMQASELRRAVELPAGRVGLRVEPELADALVDDVEGEPGALPLLSTALLELWQKRHDNTLTLAAYRESGGVHGAVARLAEGTYARIPDEHKPLVRALMLRLVGEGEGDAPVRRRASLAELDLERDRWMADVLATLADSRLVTVSEGNVEVAHEALLREWPRLREWIEEDTEGRRLRRHITQAATEWDAAGRDQGELYRGARLAAALDWTADHALDVNELEREFVTESREASEKETKRVRRTNRRLRGLLAGVAVLLVAAVAGGIFAARPARRGRETRRRPSSPSASAPRRSSRRTSTSRSCSPARRSRSTTRRRPAATCSPTLRRSPAAIGIMHGDGDVLRGIAISPDGKTLAVRCWRRRGSLLRRADLRADRGPAAATDSGAGALRTAPTGEPSRSAATTIVRLIDARTREQLAETAVDGAAQRMAFTKDGSQLVVLVAPGSPDRASADADAQITIRDAATLEPIGRSIEPEAFVGAYVGSLVRVTPICRSHRTIASSSPRPRTVSWRGGISGAARRRGRWRIETGLAPALAVSPDGRTAAVGMQARGAARRPPYRNRANGSRRSRREPELGALQPGRQDGRVDEPRQDGDSLGRRVGDTPRDAARPLELRAAAGLQPRRGDALHGESRRHRDRLGSHGRPQARAAVHVHARPDVLHDRLRRPPGEAQPRRPVDRGRPQGAGHRALGRARAHAGRGAPTRYGRRGQVARLLTGWANACGRDRRPCSRSGMSVRDRCSTGRSTRGPVHRARRRLQPGRSDARYGEQRPRLADSGTSATGDSLDDARIRRARERRCLQR